jgi:hypothetical protein
MRARTRSEISLRGKEERQKSDYPTDRSLIACHVESCRPVDDVTLSETINQLQQFDYQLVIRVNLSEVQDMEDFSVPEQSGSKEYQGSLW